MSNETIIDEYKRIIDSVKFVSEGKNEPNLKDFQDSKKIFNHIKNVYELFYTGDTTPVHMTIGFTNYCQHKCPWCYINWQQAGRTSERSGAGDVNRKAINASDRLIDGVGEAAAIGLKAVTIVGDGEPTLHKKFVEYLKRLKSFNLDIGMFSNFSFDKKEILYAMLENCFFIRASLDSAKKEYHDKSHGNDDFDKVVNNIRDLLKLRGTKKFPIIGAQYVTNTENYKDLPYAAEFYKNLGVDYMTIKPMLKNDLNVAHKSNDLEFKEVFPYMRDAEKKQSNTFKVYAKYSQFLELLGRKTNDGVYYKKCLATPLSPYLDEDGNVEMCGNLKGRGFTMGNIYKNSFSEIWNSDQRKNCIKKIDLFKCPSGCRLDPLNKTLWDSFQDTKREKIHTNFV
jgi:cyclic pyranopterin phosphate synthase